MLPAKKRFFFGGGEIGTPILGKQVSVGVGDGTVG